MHSFNKILTLIKTAAGETKGLQRICDILRDQVEHYDWVGFYIADNQKRELRLGPFSGDPTDHTVIPYGRGICGQAAQTKDVFLVQDVSRETNYLSCSLQVKAEIVLPVMRAGVFAAELDIDSHQTAPFTAEDREFLEQVCVIASELPGESV